MSDEHSARAGSLNAHLTSVQMEIDDDDEDIILVVVDVVNESSIPVGGLDAAIVDAKGATMNRWKASVPSDGPHRQFKFEARSHRALGPLSSTERPRHETRSLRSRF